MQRSSDERNSVANSATPLLQNGVTENLAIFSNSTSSKDSEPAMEVDDMLSHAGDFGRYQFLMMFLFCIINVLSAFHYFGQTFISVIPDHYCNDDIIPEKGYCSEWKYNLTYDYHSLITEYNWFGVEGWKPALGQSLFFIGSVFGTLVLGILADHVGRLRVLILANLLSLAGNSMTALVTNLPEFGICRFVAGLATDSNFLMMYILVMEYVRPNMRTLGLNLCIGVFYTLGCMVVPWIAVATGNWRQFLLTISIPVIVVPFYYFVIPESARWLINRGEVEKAVQCFLRVASFNGKKIAPETIRIFKASTPSKPSQQSPSLFGLFKTPRLRRKTCILIFKSVVLTVCYDAISRNVNDSGYDPFILFTVSSATILPACIIILCLQEKVGRKAMASASLLITGLFTCAAGIIIALSSQDSNSLLTAALAITGRFGVNVAYNSGAQYAAELIPTQVRGQGVAAIHVAGYAATFFSPHILYLASYWRPIPELLLGSLSVMGAALCLLLPETMGKSLPLTLEDGEAFGEGEGVWEFACWKKPKENQVVEPDRYVKMTDTT